jgi:hypothetical protein
MIVTSLTREDLHINLSRWRLTWRLAFPKKDGPSWWTDWGTKGHGEVGPTI